MSGTIKTVQEAIDALMEQDARLTQEVADEGAAVAKATAMLASIPQLIDAAVQQALANGPLNEAQQSAFSSLRDHLKAEADTFDTQTTALDAAATPAAPPPA